MRSNIRHAGLALLAVVTLGPLAGCSSLLPSRGPAPDLYQLSPVRLDAQRAKKAPAQLVVELPQAARGLDTDRIVVRSDPYEIKYLADVRWTDHVPGLVQSALLQGFESAGSFMGVGRPENALSTNYALQSDLQAFDVVTGGDGPHAEIRLSARFVRSPGGEVLASRLFTSEVPSHGRSNNAIVQSFDEAMKAITADVVAWGVKTARDNPVPPPMPPLAAAPDADPSAPALASSVLPSNREPASREQPPPSQPSDLSASSRSR